MALSDLSENGRCRRLVEAMANYVNYILDPEGIVWSWNADAQRFNGYEASEIIGCTFRDSYTDEDRKISRLHQLNAICAILGASDRVKSLDLRGLGLRKRL